MMEECFSASKCASINIAFSQDLARLQEDATLHTVRVTGKLNVSTISRSIQVLSDEPLPRVKFKCKSKSASNPKTNGWSANMILGFQNNLKPASQRQNKYSLDALDVQFLELYLEIIGPEEAKHLNKQNCARIFDSFEEDLAKYFVSNHLSNLVESQPICNAPSYLDTVCQICFNPESNEGNPIVVCDSCGVSVHQYCYGLSRIPKGSWLCLPCSHNHLKPLCYLCGNDINGAFTQMKTKEIVWAHSICALWVPEATFEECENKRQIKLKTVSKRRKSNACYICGLPKVGLSLCCDKDGCDNWFHVSCAFAANLTMLCHLKEDNTVVRETYCHLHPKHVKPKNPEDYYTIYPPPDQLKSKQDYLSTFKSWAQKATSIQALQKRLKINVVHLKNLQAYWILKKKKYHFNYLKPPNFNEKCKEIYHKIHMVLEMKARLANIRCEMEKVRNISYLLIKREKIKLSNFQDILEQINSSSSEFIFKNLKSYEPKVEKRIRSPSLSLEVPESKRNKVNLFDETTTNNNEKESLPNNKEIVETEAPKISNINNSSTPIKVEKSTKTSILRNVSALALSEKPANNDLKKHNNISLRMQQINQSRTVPMLTRSRSLSDIISTRSSKNFSKLSIT